LKISAEGQDVLVLGFALPAEEVRRLAPSRLKIETREHDGESHGFVMLGLAHFTEFYPENFPPLSFNFSIGLLGFCMRNHRDQPALYVKQSYVPRLQSLFFTWLGGLPTTTMSLDFPRRAHPGGEYHWTCTGSGAGELIGKIEQGSGTSGRLSDFFRSSDAVVDFFRERSFYYGGFPEDLRELQVEVRSSAYHPVVFEKLELGFIASDLERNKFPEAVLGSFFVPKVNLVLEGNENVTLNQ
jgi:hypothetical protein